MLNGSTWVFLPDDLFDHHVINCSASPHADVMDGYVLSHRTLRRADRLTATLSQISPWVGCRPTENRHLDVCFRCTCALLCIQGCARNFHGLSYDGSATREGNRAPHLALQKGHTLMYLSGSTILPMQEVHCTVSTLRQLVGLHFTYFPCISNTPKRMLYPSSVLFMTAR